MPRTYIFRAQGLPVGTTKEQLEQIFCEKAGDKVNLCEVDLQTIHDPVFDEDSCTAIFGVEHEVPEFLKPLVSGTNSRPEITIKYNGEVVAVDANFYGFTQLYPTRDPIRAEYDPASLSTGIERCFVNVYYEQPQHYCYLGD